jgi:predicted nucleic acid-binding protein
VKRYVVDSNLYIEAIRDSRTAPALAEFVVAYAPNLLLHAIVAQELTAGATSTRSRRQLERELLQPFERRGRLVVPTYAAWKRSGEIIAELIARGDLSVGGVPRSFPNDALIAASCREAGVTLITRNRADFDRIRKVEPVGIQAPWPRKSP